MSNKTPSSAANDRLAQISGQLSGKPPIPRYAGSSVGARLDNKIAIITGCDSTSGIGIATAWQFAENGCEAIYICDFVNKNLTSHAEAMTTAYPDCKIHERCFDAADDASVKAVCQDALDMYGRLDIFFANAGITGPLALFPDIDAEQWMEVMRVNTLSVHLAVKHASPAMMVEKEGVKNESRGSIIATASVAGLRSGAGTGPYSASKAAVINTMQTSAWQLSGTNVRCNAICPGLIETGMTRSTFESARARGTSHKIGQLNPARRGAVADEVARAALFLASDESSYINAFPMVVDGGLSGSHPVMPGKIG